MTKIVRNWVDKAEDDFVVAQRELRARKSPSYNASCFHAQQCAEKYLKAILQSKKTPFPKTHNLEKLIDLLPPDVTWLALRPRVIPLSLYAVELRYPGADATKAQAQAAMKVCREVRAHARGLLKLPVK
jgi:HEPN domain-containing protein